MDLRRVLDVLGRRAIVIFIVAAVAMGVVTAVGVLNPPVYQAKTTVRILLDVGVADFKLRGEDIDRLFTTYSEILISEPVLAEAIRRLEPRTSGLSVAGLRSSTDVEAAPNSELIAITVQNHDPVLARDLADTLAAQLIDYSEVFLVGRTKSAPEIVEEQVLSQEAELAEERQELSKLEAVDPNSDEASTLARQIKIKEDTYQRLLDRYEMTKLYESLRANGIKVIVPASVPQTPSNQLGWEEIALSLIIGLFAGVALALVLDNLDTRVHSSSQLQLLTGRPVLGTVPRGSLPASTVGYISETKKDRAITEAYQFLSINLQALREDSPFQTIMLAYATPKEASSLVALNLGASMAQFGQGVILVDARLNLPSVHKTLNLPNTTGLTSVLEEKDSLEHAVQTNRIPGLDILTSGPVPLNPAEYLASPRMEALTQRLGQQYDTTLLHAGSALTATDAAILARTADGVILLVDQRSSRQDHVRSALGQIQATRAQVLGLIFVQKKD